VSHFNTKSRSVLVLLSIFLWIPIGADSRQIDQVNAADAQLSESVGVDPEPNPDQTGTATSAFEEEARVAELRRYSSDDIHRKNWNRALNEIRELVTLRPYHPDYHLTLGLIHRRLEGVNPGGIHLEEAIRKYEEYTDFGGEDAIAALLMAEAYAHVGNRDGAFQHLERAASYGMNIARAVQQFPALKEFTNDTRFVRASLRLERYNLSNIVRRDPFTGPWNGLGHGPMVTPVGPFDPLKQSELLAEAREAMALVEYAIRNDDQVAAMKAYGVIEAIGKSIARFDQPEFATELRSIMERLDEVEEGIDKIRVGYLYEQARSKMETMKVAFSEHDFDLVHRLHGEVLSIGQDIGQAGEPYKAASVLVIQAADQFLQRSEIVREFVAKQVSVEGVVVAPEGSHAIIDGNLIPEGGQIHGGWLEDVRRDRVIFLYHGELIAHKFGRF
jgi:tetratricopeptide (TPR) repeat protein